MREDDEPEEDGETMEPVPVAVKKPAPVKRPEGEPDFSEARGMPKKADVQDGTGKPGL